MYGDLELSSGSTRIEKRDELAERMKNKGMKIDSFEYHLGKGNTYAIGQLLSVFFWLFETFPPSIDPPKLIPSQSPHPQTVN